MNRSLTSGIIFLVVLTLLVMKINFSFEEAAVTSPYKTDAQPNRSSESLEKPPTQYKELWYLLTQIKNTWLYTLSKNISLEEKTKANEAYTISRQGIEKLMKPSEYLRKEELNRLSEYVQRKIYNLQHPEDCSKSKILVCDMTFQCGFGCTAHMVVNCLLAALEAERTMVPFFSEWKYADEGWNYAFEPISSCTVSGNLGKFPKLTENTTNTRVVKFGRLPLQWMSFTLPEKLAPELKRLHGDPFTWWIAQFMSQVFKPKKWLEKHLQKSLKRVKDTTPIVGIHVRRGDKVDTEARYHSVDEYMFYVEQWYNMASLDGDVTKRTVLLATDDSTVLPELRSKFPEYEFIMNKELDRTIETEERYTKKELINVINDIYTLSHSDYVVCTLTSLVCRTVYTLMMQLKPDPSIRIQSVDMPYRYRIEKESYWEVIARNENKKQRELTAEKGDIIRVFILPWSSYNQGMYLGYNTRTRRNGPIPAIKLRQMYNSHHFSMFDDYNEAN